jgi:hypothetical protein
MTEIERAEEYAIKFIKLFEKHSLVNFPIINADFIWEDEDFQELTMQQIRLKGYQVSRHNDIDGLALALSLEK